MTAFGRTPPTRDHAPRRRLILALAVLLPSLVTPLPASEKQLPDRSGTQWAPYLEWRLSNPSHEGNPFDLVATATFVHPDSGERRTTGMFYDGGDTWKFRFTATRPGRWTFSTSSADPDLDGYEGAVTVGPNPGAYGFVTHLGNKWARQVGESGAPEAFVPQFVMYDGPHRFHGQPERIDAHIKAAFAEHGFNGFHVPVLCRWFDLEQESSSGIRSDDPNPDPRTFEALELLITKTHAAGGVVHLWAWGDDQRGQTPAKWGINGKADKRLQRYIAARLGPLPGWTMGYGFDLWEWADGGELAEWHRHLHAHFGWPHLLGARASKNKLDQLTEALDYSSYEQHRPDYATYVRTIERRPEKPSFSEDRFRIRESGYPEKDYDMERTRRGLWHSAMAGGVANIWGCLLGEGGDGGPALPYPDPHAIRTYAEFFRHRFLNDLRRDNTLTDGVCLRTPDSGHFLFYKEETDSLRMDLAAMPGPRRAVAIDTRKPYREIDLGRLEPRRQEWKAPHRSDWAIAVGEFRADRGKKPADGADAEPIRPYAKNPFYWEYKGKPVLLLGGSDDDNLFQWEEPRLREHLDRLAAAGGNYVRNTMSARDEGNLQPFARLPDGRYDLGKFNEEYWKRFETLLRLARERDIIVQIELWDRFDFAREPWEKNAYNPENNVTYTAEQSGLKPRYPQHPGGNQNPFFRTVPELENNETVLKYQRAQVDRMLSISLNYPNVLYCMDNETSGRPEWGAYWANHIRRRAKEKGVEVHTTEMWDPWDLSDPLHRNTFDHPETYSFIDVSQNNHQKGQAHWDNMQAQRRRVARRPRPMNNVKIYGADGGRYGNDRDGIERFWRNVIGGMASARFHRPDSGLGLSDKARPHLKSARMLADALPWHACEPHNDLLSDRGANEAYCLADPGRRYAVYFPDGGSVTLDLRGAGGELTLRWLDIAAGRWRPEEKVPGGGRLPLKPPGAGHWAVLITK